MLTIPFRAVGECIRHSRISPTDSQEATTRRAQLRQTVRAGLVVTPVWFAANFTYNMSMSLTSITASTVISSSSAAFTLLLSVVWLGEQLTPLKIAGVAMCTFGNTLTVMSDADGDGGRNATVGTIDSNESSGLSSSFLGDAICLLSAVLYACYTTLIRRFSPADLSLFFGVLGLTTFVVFGPVVALLHWTGAEDLSALTPAIGALLLCKGFFDNVLSDYLWAVAV